MAKLQKNLAWRIIFLLLITLVMRISSFCSRKELLIRRTSDRPAPINLEIMMQILVVDDKIWLVASDCNPRWLTKHMPVIFVKDDKEGSLRLGELVELKTAIAVGVKAKANNINKLFDEILHGSEINLESDWI